MSPSGKLFSPKAFEFLKSDLCSPSYGPFTLNSLVEGLFGWVRPAAFTPARFTPAGSARLGSPRMVAQVIVRLLLTV